MESIYKIFKCKRKRCRKETILLTEEVSDTIKKGGYISCSHCGAKVEESEPTNNLKECMEHSAYARKNGAIRQVRSG